jgi:hypothetical protein
LDLFHQNGDVEPLTESDLIDRARQTLMDYQGGPMANYIPYAKHTNEILRSLAELKPRTIATMHGSAYAGDGERALRALSQVFQAVLG